MDKTTLKALKGSIKKWEGIVAGSVEDEGPDNCPLCLKFNNFPNTPARLVCRGCPVRGVTGKKFCAGTPYIDWIRALRLRRDPFAENKAGDDETVMCAVLELEFLKSLLPSKRSRK